MSDLSNKELAAKYPSDTYFVVYCENNKREILLYHGNDKNEAKKIQNENANCVFIEKN